MNYAHALRKTADWLNRVFAGRFLVPAPVNDNERRRAW